MTFEMTVAQNMSLVQNLWIKQMQSLKVFQGMADTLSEGKKGDGSHGPRMVWYNLSPPSDDQS